MHGRVKWTVTPSQHINKPSTYRRESEFGIPRGLTQEERDTLTYGVETFTFLLPAGTYTWDQFADIVAGHSADQRAVEVARVARLAHLLMPTILPEPWQDPDAIGDDLAPENKYGWRHSPTSADIWG